MEKQTDWVRAADARDLPFSKSLIYKWHHERKNLHCFSKVGGALFVDRVAVLALLEQNRLDRA